MELQLEFVPPKDEIRRRMAANVREMRILRSLYRVAIKAEESRREYERIFARPADAAAGECRA